MGMSYICQLCNTVVPAGLRCEKVVTQRRIKHYPYRSKANTGYATKGDRLVYPIRKSNKRSDRVDDPGGTGWEIVQESLLCQACKIKSCQQEIVAE